MPATRAECEGPGLCPKFLCRYNLTLEITRGGSIKLQAKNPGRGERTVWPAIPDGDEDARYPNWSPGDGERFVDRLVAWLERADLNCALDLAEVMGSMTAEEIADRLGVHENYVLKVEAMALGRLADDPIAIRVLRQIMRELAELRSASGDVEYES